MLKEVTDSSPESIKYINMKCEAIPPLLQYGILAWLLTLMSSYHHTAVIKSMSTVRRSDFSCSKGGTTKGVRLVSWLQGVQTIMLLAIN